MFDFIDFTKLHWESDFMSYEVYGDSAKDFTVGVFRIHDFPNVVLYINYEENKIIEAYVGDVEDSDIYDFDKLKLEE